MSRVKFFVNSPQCAVDDSLEGLVLVNPHLQLIRSIRTVVRKDLEDVKSRGQVTILSGGGSGHEPSHVGFVSSGMLTAAVSGDIFASPSVNNILAALHAVQSPGGTIVIVTNYTGDRLNFGLAIEQYKTLNPTSHIEMVLVEDDSATADSPVGARGICGTVLYHKLLGAMAEDGRPFAEIIKFAEKLKKQLVTLAVALEPCGTPGQKKNHPGMGTRWDEYEVGLGIHNEPGVEIRQMEPAAEVIGNLMETVFKTSPAFSGPVGIFLNNLGGLTVLEINNVVKEVLNWTSKANTDLASLTIGTFMTSLNMPGVSVTVVIYTELVRKYLSFPTECKFWVSPTEINKEPFREFAEFSEDWVSSPVLSKENQKLVSADAASLIRAAVRNAASAICEAETELNQLDSAGGDGDCGTTLKHLGDNILEADSSFSYNVPQQLFRQLSHLAGSTCGTTGALYGVLFGAFARNLQEPDDAESWAKATQAAMHSFLRYSRAKVGQKSMLDALVEIEGGLNGLRKNSGQEKISQLLKESAVKCEKAAEKTKNMIPLIGRANYSRKRSDVLCLPDPGAVGVSVWFSAVSDTIK